VIPLDEARRYVLSGVAPLPPRPHALADALGLVLAEDVVAPEPVPPFAGSAMDGFAVRAADTRPEPAVLTIVGTVAAGEAPAVPVGPGQAMRIMTGAPVPTGADAVVMVERTEVAGDGTSVTVLEGVDPGTSVRPAGDDLIAGQHVFGPGTVLTPGHLGVLASIGRTEVLAHPRPRVGVFSTGDELVEGPGPLQPGQIRDSNRLTLLALLRDGCDGVDLGRVPDDEEAIAAAMGRATDYCDAVVTSGGVSMGDFDYVRVVLDRLGDMRWMQVAIKPAKPLAFGTVARTAGARPARVPVFGLPGNPVSSMVSFELFARPALRKMAGHPAGDPGRPRVAAVTDEPLRRRPDGKVHFVRVVCHWDTGTGGYRVRSAGGQGSHQLTAMAAANALAVLPDGGPVDAGQRVEVLLLDPHV
jgi:molybdopterin molybdotransferase